jgi:26S proteasome regulatory subunit N2
MTLALPSTTRDKDPILRYGGMYTIATAYSGTGNNSAIRRLLHVAVSDVSDDVRRAAVTCLGFVLTTIPEQCPRVVSLLAESYNPHVRYGSTVRKAYNKRPKPFAECYLILTSFCACI